MKQIIFAVIFLWSSLLLAEVTGETATTITYRQADNVEVVLKKFPQRVEIGYLSFASIWDQVGGKAVGVVAGNEDEALPESMRSLPKIGGGMTPDLEKVMLLNPDLVLLSDKISRHQMAARQLRAAGVPVLSLTYNNFEDYRQILDLFCRLNRNQGAADFAPANQTIAEVEAVCSQAKDQKPVRFAVIFAKATGISLESNQSNAGKILEMLHAVNIRRDVNGPLRLSFSFEQFLLEDPELILIVTMGDSAALRTKVKQELFDRPAWQELQAARNHRVHFLDPELFLFLSGPKFPQAFQVMYQFLYPEVAP